MQYRVLTTSKSPRISEGLTYDGGTLPLSRGSHVRVPLRRKIVEGIVIDVLRKREKEAYDVKAVHELVGITPLLTEAQIKTLLWMSEYYCCSLRQALSVWIPSPPWKSLNLTEPLRSSTVSLPAPALTPSQKRALDSIIHSAKPSLLFGVTGSGKTEIYATLIAETIAQGKQAILLVPEILLTEHIVERFSNYLHRDRIAVLHSRLKPSSRRKEWRRIHTDSADLIIGSRSALFAPARNLGLVIIDEEHEWTYKNEQTPRYHARETAQKLCEIAGATLVLGSATPSLESWARAKSGEYHLVELRERYRNSPMPAVRVIDLGSVAFKDHYPFSPSLLSAIAERLRAGEQSILFLNRRGTGSALLCMECRKRVVSPESNLPFTVHTSPQGIPYLMDHTTGTTSPMPEACPSCGNVALRAVGAGTQRIEHILAKMYPEARILRADTDVLKYPEQMRMLLQDMAENRADILLGTQSVVKGLDLPNVTLAAVLLADIGLSLPHFRAGERIFQLLTQLVGRSGRMKPGEVIIQTYRPNAPEIRLAAEHRTRDFLEQELKLRIFGQYPPVSAMIRLIVRGGNPRKRAVELRSLLSKRSEELDLNLRIAASPTLFSGGKVWHILIRGNDPRRAFEGIDLEGDVVVDVGPVECV